MNHALRRTLPFLCAAASLSTRLHAQTPAPARAARAPRAQAAVRTLAFTDTNGVRVELRMRDGAALAGQAARATLRDAKGATVWSGALGTATADGTDAVVRGRTPALAVQRWSPGSPTRYALVVEVGAGDRAVRDSATIGFRTVAYANGRILLNGRALFLRGNAINPPGRNVPDSLSENPRFARDYLRGLKAAGVNIVRLGSMSEVWLDAADDVGMLVYQGHYGIPRGGTAGRPPADLPAALAWYTDEVLAPQVNHPSVIIYALSNETSDAEIHYASDGAPAMLRFLTAVYDRVHAWDPTRLIIANAGYGFGRVGEVCDLHRYWGWYYNSVLSFYTLRDPQICWRNGRTGQPITLSEVVGNYTGADGRFNLVSATKQPDSQLNWTGHAPDAEQGPRALAYQAWMAGQSIEITRRLRAINPNLAGLAPFTIVFGAWHGITKFADMQPKPVLAQYARSYQPVLLSFESWSPQLYAGSTLAAVAHVVNDADNGAATAAATLITTLRDASGRVVNTQRLPWPVVPYYGTAKRALRVAIPASATAGRYTIDGVLVAGRDTLSRNAFNVRVHARENATPITGRTLRVYDASQRTTRALATLGITATAVTQVHTLDPAKDALVIGREAWDPGLTGQVGLLEQFVNRGGRVLILDQQPGAFPSHWLPGGVRLSLTNLDHAEVFPGGRPWAQGMAINPERPTHAVFAGLDRDDLFLMDDYTNWNENMPGFPAVYPVTRGFALTRLAEMGRVSVLANYDHGLLGVALAEFFSGNGSTVLSGFDLVPRVGRDPVADRLLRNLVRYVVADTLHESRPVMADAITWGSYDSERGLVTGVHSGLLLNTVPTMPEALKAQYPVKIDADGFWLAGDAGGWNTRPAVQYVARGRRPFGPYEFTSGGSYKRLEGAPTEGEGRVWWRVPAGRTTTITTIENPTTVPLDVTITINDATVRERIAAGATSRITVPLQAPKNAKAGAPIPVAMQIRGDVRLVLLETLTR